MSEGPLSLRWEVLKVYKAFGHGIPKPGQEPKGSSGRPTVEQILEEISARKARELGVVDPATD